MRHPTRLALLGSALLLALTPCLPPAPHARAAEDSPRGALRIAVPAREGPHSHITPLVYWGGFQTKTAVYEPLVRFGPDGRLEGVLLSSWSVSADGRVYRLRVREGVRAHDGTPIDAAAVRDHLLRWRGNPGNRWLGSTDRMASVEAAAPLEVVVTLSDPWCFLEECAVVNPGHVVAPGAYDHEGTFRAVVGTGPYRVAEARPNESYRLEAHDAWWQGRPGLGRIDLVRMPPGMRESPDLVEWVRSGGVDLVADGEGPIVPREELAALVGDPRVRVWVGEGSGTTFLSLNTKSGPLADRENRRRLAAAVDRDALVRAGELGYATPVTTLFAPGRAGWPAEGRTAAPAAGGAPFQVTMLMSKGAAPRLQRHARLLRGQLARVGIDLVLAEVADATELRERLARGEGDLGLRSTHGVPYDPFVMLQTLFLPLPAGRTASSAPPVWEDGALLAQVRAGLAATDAGARARAFAGVQARLDEEVPLVPLFASKRVALSAAGVEGLSVGPDGFTLGLGWARSSLPVRPVGEPPGASAPVPAAPATPAPAAPDAPPPASTPKDGEVRLPGAGGWDSSLVLDNEQTGVWTVASMKVFERLGCPEVVGLDDKGTCIVLTSYSGRWTPIRCLADGKWLGGLALADLDPEVEGAELYVGGEKGNLYQLTPHANGVIGEALVASFPGQAVNILVAGEVDPSLPGPELLAFTWPDGLYVLKPAAKGRTFDVVRKDLTPERVRDALVVEDPAGGPPTVVTASRNGHLCALTFGANGPAWRILHDEAMGMGRVARKPSRPGEPLVLYSCLDDGRVLRHEARADGTLSAETVYLGPQGARGLATGRFDADPAVETVAVYGYSGRVELLSRPPGGRWSAETIFHDRDKGHWLAAAELDGRNATQELLASGYGGRIVLLSRPVGYGRPELASPAGR